MKAKTTTPAYFFLFSILFSLAYNISSAQSDEDLKRLKEIQNRRSEIYRSISDNEELRKLNREYNEIIARSPSFGAFTFGWELSKAGITVLNADANVVGIPSMNDKFHSIVFGYSRMNKRITGDLLFHISFPNSTSSSTHQMKLSGGGASWTKGYAIISTDRILFFPFAGIGWQSYTLRVSEKNYSPTASSLLDISQGSKSGVIDQGSLYGSVGAQFHLIWTNSKRKQMGWHTGFRLGYNPPLIKGKLRYSDGETNYEPDIKWREFQISLLVNIFGKTYYNRLRS